MTQHQPHHFQSVFSIRRAGKLLIGSLLIPAMTAPALASPTDVAAAQPSALPSADLQLPARRPNATTVISSPNDPSHYRTLTLTNGLRVLLVHDPHADSASAAVDVNAGSAQEPADVPGLAHFLEHMLFISTKRYPTPGEFMNVISANSGKTNAYTASDHTNFTFSVPAAHFHDALDRFAQFFVAPQFNPEYVDRERHAVDSEYHLQMQNDAFRLNDVVSTVTNQDHPFHRFSVGSLATLKDGPAGTLRDRLVRFHSSHYSARNMTLVVMGPQSLDQLQRWVYAAFKDVPNRRVESAPITADLIRPDQLPMAVTVRSQQETPEVLFTFQVPSDVQHMQEQPMRFIGTLLGDESDGSLLSRLREQGWATGLNVQTFDTDRRHDLYTIEISLTASGRDHLDDIQASVFAYIDQIRHSLDPWRFEEQSLLARQQFRFLQTDTSFERASSLAALMQQVPASEVNVAAFRLEHFDPTLINQALDSMTPARLMRLYMAPDAHTDRITPNFKAPYAVHHITQWPAGHPLDKLRLAPSNPFIAKDLSVLPLKATPPRNITLPPGMDLWYAPNSSFGTPSVEWRLNLLSPLSARSLRDQMLNALLAGWLNDSLSSALYPAALAGQDSGASAHTHGLTITLAGWRDGQTKVMDTLLEQLHTGTIKPDSFKRVKQLIADNMRDEEHAALFRQLTNQALRRLVAPHWDTPSALKALDALTVEDLIAYRTEWLKHLHIQGVVAGNLDEATAQQTASVIQRQLKPLLPLSSDLKPSVLAVTKGLATFRPQTDQKDTAVFRYAQGQSDTAEESARYLLLGQMMSQPFFAQLRTREQLGYVATASEHSLLSVPGIMYVLQSPNHDSKTLFKRIAAWEHQFDGTITALNDTQLRRYKVALVAALKERDTSLEDMTNRLWGQVLMGWTRFDRRDVMIRAVQRVTVGDIKSTWHAFRQAPHFDGAADSGVPATTQDITAGLKPFPLTAR